MSRYADLNARLSVGVSRTSMRGSIQSRDSRGLLSSSPRVNSHVGLTRDQLRKSLPSIAPTHLSCEKSNLVIQSESGNSTSAALIGQSNLHKPRTSDILHSIFPFSSQKGKDSNGSSDSEKNSKIKNLTPTPQKRNSIQRRLVSHNAES